MNIALDFDDTYTRDPMFWDQFITNAKSRGHDVRIVTFRKSCMTDPIFETIGIPVIFTEFTQKRSHCNKIGWFVDVWIDDSPEFIVNPVVLVGK